MPGDWSSSNPLALCAVLLDTLLDIGGLHPATLWGILLVAWVGLAVISRPVPSKLPAVARLTSMSKLVKHNLCSCEGVDEYLVEQEVTPTLPTSA